MLKPRFQMVFCDQITGLLSRVVILGWKILLCNILNCFFSEKSLIFQYFSYANFRALGKPHQLRQGQGAPRKMFADSVCNVSLPKTLLVLTTPFRAKMGLVKLNLFDVYIDNVYII